MLDQTPPKPAQKGSILKFGFFWLLLFAGAGLVAFEGFMSRQIHNEALAKRSERHAAQSVSVIMPAAAANTGKLELPGRLDAYSRAPLFARVNGYIKKWTVDIGANVTSGQLLAEIEAPDLDQQLLQAEHQLQDAKAAAELAEVTAKRYQELLPQSFVSRQNADEKITDAASKKAQVKSVQANLDRLKALIEYKRIVAPFDGVVTARNIDVGNLISSGSVGLPLFVVADTRKLRVYVNVPQTYVPQVPIGSQAELSAPEYPSRVFTATVEASSQSVDAASGMTQMLLMVDNKDSALLTGAYVTVRFKLPKSNNALQIPSSALIFDSGGLRVAAVGEDNKVVSKPIKIGRDYGKVIEVASGLSPTDRVIDSPPDGLTDGETVMPIAAKAETASK